RKPISTFYKNRIRSIRETLKQSAENVDKAKLLLEKTIAEEQRLPETEQNIRAESDQITKQKTAAIDKEAVIETEKIRKQAETSKTIQIQQADKTLRAYLVQHAVNHIENMLRQESDPDADRRLVADCIDQLDTVLQDRER
ncbi:hypothetical protein JW979_04815, partial [bacterium]|nr:hypothetical protein [candidate division CSSED10-310 bacterium]